MPPRLQPECFSVSAAALNSISVCICEVHMQQNPQRDGKLENLVYLTWEAITMGQDAAGHS